MKTLYGIVYYKRDNSNVSKYDAFIRTNREVININQTTIGWKFLIQCKDGTKTWMPLKILMEFNPVEVANFAVPQGISDEPVSLWWMPFTLKKRDRIISSVNSRVREKTHNFGIQVTMSIEHAK